MHKIKQNIFLLCLPISCFQFNFKSSTCFISKPFKSVCKCIKGNLHCMPGTYCQ